MCRQLWTQHSSQQAFEMGEKRPVQCFLIELSDDQLIRCIPLRAGIGKFLIFRRRDFLQSYSRMAGSCRAGWHVTKVKGAVEASSGIGGFTVLKVFVLKFAKIERNKQKSSAICVAFQRRGDGLWPEVKRKSESGYFEDLWRESWVDVAMLKIMYSSTYLSPWTHTVCVEMLGGWREREGWLFTSIHREVESCVGEVSSSRDGAYSRRQWGGVRVQHGKRGVLPEAAQDLPVSPTSHRSVRDDVRGYDVVWDTQTAEEDGGHGTQVPATPRVALGATPR